jgi:hypothetical protein
MRGNNARQPETTHKEDRCETQTTVVDDADVMLAAQQLLQQAPGVVDGEKVQQYRYAVWARALHGLHGRVSK